MATFEDLRILKLAEGISDAIWERVIRWDDFAKDVVGKQLTRAADSIGANISESFGRFHYGEKLQFLYYARGSVFETKYWLNRAQTRKLLSASEAQAWLEEVTSLARQLNAFAGGLKEARSRDPKSSKGVREPNVAYSPENPDDIYEALFTEADLHFLAAK